MNNIQFRVDPKLSDENIDLWSYRLHTLFLFLEKTVFSV